MTAEELENLYHRAHKLAEELATAHEHASAFVIVSDCETGDYEIAVVGCLSHLRHAFEEAAGYIPGLMRQTEAKDATEAAIERMKQP